MVGAGRREALNLRRPAFGRPKLGYLASGSLLTIFGATVVRGWVDGDPFVGAVLCFEGAADSPTSLLWTDKGRLKVLRRDREAWLLLAQS